MVLPWRLTGAILVIRLDLAFEFHRDRAALAVDGFSGRNADPAFRNAIFFHVGFLDTVEANADLALENLPVIVRVLGIDRETVGECVVIISQRFSCFSPGENASSG